MNMKEFYQVNGYYSHVEELYEYGIIRYNENGHQGRTTGTVYLDGGSDFTDWCLFVGTLEDCQQYIESIK